MITTSRFPGTTLDRIEIPLENGHFLIDTPGIMTDNQLATHLNAKDLELISPKKPLKPATYQLMPGNTLFLAGLGRIDYLKGESTSFTVYVARNMYVHRTKTANADAFYENSYDYFQKIYNRARFLLCRNLAGLLINNDKQLSEGSG